MTHFFQLLFHPANLFAVAVVTGIFYWFRLWPFREKKKDEWPKVGKITRHILDEHEQKIS